MRRSQLTGWQVFFLLAAMIVSAGHFIFVRIVILETGRDAWMVVLPGAAIGFVSLYGVLLLHKELPNATLIQITMQTYGPWLGRLLALPYLLFFMAVSAVVLRGLGDFLPTTMPYTPYIVITAMVILLASITVKSGVEVLGRTAQMTMPILVLMGVTASLLTAKDKDFSYLLPMGRTHWDGYLRGTLVLGGLFSEVVVAGMLLPFVKHQMVQTKSVLRFFAVIAVMFIGPMIGPITIFDANTAVKFNYPTFEEIRYIEIANFLERLDVLGIVLWTAGAFLKMGLYLYAQSCALAELIGLQDYRQLVLPLAAFTLVAAAEMATSRAEMWHYLREAYPYFCLTIGLLWPWMTLLVSRLRRKVGAANVQAS